MKAASLRYNARVERVNIQLPPFTAGAPATKRRLGFVVGAHKEKGVTGGVGTAGEALYRIVGVDIATLVVPADADSTMKIDVIVYDRSEDAEDVIVLDFDAEALVAKRTTEMALVAETETFRTLAEGDAIIIDLKHNAAAIDTNWVEGDASITISLLRLDVPGEGFGYGL